MWLSVGCGGIGWRGEKKNVVNGLIRNFGSWLKEVVTADVRNRCMDRWISTLVPNGVPEYGLYDVSLVYVM